MNADAITARILEDARKSASQTLREAESRTAALRAEDERRRADQLERAMEQARKDSAELRDRMLRMAELDQKKELLGAKRGVIDLAFEAALENMRAMPAHRARAFMEKRLVEFSEGDERVIVSEGDEATFDQSFIDQVNATLEKAGKSCALALSGEIRPLGGGLILSRGGMEVNFTYPSILAERRPALEAEVAAILFE